MVDVRVAIPAPWATGQSILRQEHPRVGCGFCVRIATGPKREERRGVELGSGLHSVQLRVRGMAVSII
jgi:hypothetical protein